MSYRYLERLARKRLPIFVARPSKVRALRRLAATGHLDVRFYPPDSCDGEFGEVRALTPAGWNAIRGADSPVTAEHPQ